MLRSCFWAVAISTSLMALYPTQSVNAAASAQDAHMTTARETGNAVPAMQLVQKDPPGGGGGRGGGGGGGGAEVAEVAEVAGGAVAEVSEAAEASEAVQECAQ